MKGRRGEGGGGPGPGGGREGQSCPPCALPRRACRARGACLLAVDLVVELLEQRVVPPAADVRAAHLAPALWPASVHDPVGRRARERDGVGRPSARRDDGAEVGPVLHLARRCPFEVPVSLLVLVAELSLDRLGVRHDRRHGEEGVARAERAAVLLCRLAHCGQRQTVGAPASCSGLAPWRAAARRAASRVTESLSGKDKSSTAV